MKHRLCGLSIKTLQTTVFQRLFKGKPITDLSRLLPPFIHTLRWYEPALQRLETLRQQGWEIYIFSSSPRLLVEPIAGRIGVKHVLATDYMINTQNCLWQIDSLVDGIKKQQILQQFPYKTMAFSDSHHDLPFLEAASQSVAVNPTRTLHKIALQRRWEIL